MGTVWHKDHFGMHRRIKARGLALTKAVVVLCTYYHGTPTLYRFMALKIQHTLPVRRPWPRTRILYCEIRNRVVDTVVHCDLVRSNWINNLDFSVIESWCVSLFCHWNSNGKSYAIIVDLWAVHFKWWPMTANLALTPFDATHSTMHVHTMQCTNQGEYVFRTRVWIWCIRINELQLNFGMYRGIKARRQMVTVCTSTVM